MKLTLPVPAGFHFRNTVFSHGWYALHPFSFTADPLILHHTLLLSTGVVSRVSIRENDADNTIELRIHDARPARRTTMEIAGQVSTMLHFDFDPKPFYESIRRHPEHRWMARQRTGRFLRAATFFEDVVKTILTTNCSWSLTERMNDNLITRFGSGTGDAVRAFPTPEAIAGSSEGELREQVKLGYRAPFILGFARRCAAGTLDIEAFRTSRAPVQDLYKELRSIKGVGDYAAGNLLRLLGRFDYLGLDSWCRSKFSELHANGVSVSDADIERHYAAFGAWRGLVMWLDLTRYWYSQKFPL